MLHALSSFLGIRDVTAQVASIEESIASMVLVMTMDGNSMVRRELLIFFSTFTARYKTRFTVAAFEHIRDEKAILASTQPDERGSDALYMKKRVSANDDSGFGVCSGNTIYAAIWKELLVMSVDPHPEIAKDAGIVVDYVLIALMESSLANFVQPPLEETQKHVPVLRPVRRALEESFMRPKSPNPSTSTKDSSYLSLFGGMRKSTSVGASLKSLWTGTDSSSSTHRSVGRGKIDELHASMTDGRPQTPERYHVEEEPTPRGFRPRNLKEKPEIPLKSVFFEWSVEYFREPQMKPTEADEPGSTDYNGRLWRRNRNDKIIAETQPMKDIAGSNRWDVPRGYFDSFSQPHKMCFHQFEDHLVVTNTRDTINIFDYSKAVSRINCFSNGNPPDSKITDIRFINEDDQALLMTGSSDGVIKIFRNYDDKRKTELVTGFRALTDLVPSNKNAGLVFDWQQGRGSILVAGDVKVIRIWNAGTEVCTSVSHFPLCSICIFAAHSH